MKRLLTATLLTLLAVPQAFAADTRLELPLRELIDSPQAKAAGIDGSVRFFLAGEKTPAVVTRMGEDVTNKKTNGVGKSDVESCNWVALSALKALQEGAKDRGANAVINITSYFKKNEFRSATNYECYAGNIMSGVALKGTYVTVK
nr:excinuclease ATPase subunit [uncultured Pseudoxanthomonas sp.]